jgi:23S rRNA pseudouridine1911/1915/1917 synthase
MTKEIVKYYEDDQLLIVEKPAGLVVHATLDRSRPNLYDLLKQNYPELYLIHRLDKDTSGLILFSKKADINQELQNLLESREIKKTYLCVVHGEWVTLDGQLQDFLKKEKKKIDLKWQEVMVKVDKGGQKAILNFQVQKSNQHYSLMEMTLVTGRMHQIRVQSQLQGHSIVGDKLYGVKDQASRMMLHSHQLDFSFQDKKISVLSSMPEEFKQYF